MEYRTLGKTGLKVSLLTFGASPLETAPPELEKEESIRTVRTALELGINLIDVAPTEGTYTSEGILGKALKDLPRDSYYLATKVGIYGQVCDFTAQRAVQSVEQSLQRLGVEHVDLLQVQDVACGDLNVIAEQTLPALRQLQQQGKVRFVGITAQPLKAVETLVNQVEIDTVMVMGHYNLHDTTLTRLLPTLKAKNIGVINAAPLGMGLLTNPGPAAWHPAPPIVRQACTRAADRARKLDAPIAKLALQFATGHPDIATTRLGTLSAHTLQRNVDWLSEPVDEEHIAEIQDVLVPVRDMTWAHGRAENN